MIRCALTKHIDTDSRWTPPAAHRILSLLISFIAHHLNGSHRSSMMTMMSLFVHMMFQMHQTYGLNAFSNICPFFDPFYSSNTFLWASNTKNCSEMCDGLSHHWLKQWKKIYKKTWFLPFFSNRMMCLNQNYNLNCLMSCFFFLFEERDLFRKTNIGRYCVPTTMLYCVNTCILFFPIPHATFQCLTITLLFTVHSAIAIGYISGGCQKCM